MIEAILVFVLLWLILTIYTQLADHPDEDIGMKVDHGDYNALILYNPDPFYEFDRMISYRIGDGLASRGVSFTLKSTTHYNPSDDDYDLIVLCANTYNLSPDWRILSAIKAMDLKDRMVATATVGMRYTKRANRILNDTVLEAEATLIGNREYWVYKANDKSRLDESNVDVAKDRAYAYGQSLSGKLEMMKITSNHDPDHNILLQMY